MNGTNGTLPPDVEVLDLPLPSIMRRWEGEGEDPDRLAFQLPPGAPPKRSFIAYGKTMEEALAKLAPYGVTECREIENDGQDSRAKLIADNAPARESRR